MADTAQMLAPDLFAPESSRTQTLEPTRLCPCGVPLPPPPSDKVGRRPRLCGRCKQTRRALSYIRAGARILERLRDPDFDGEAVDG